MSQYILVILLQLLAFPLLRVVCGLVGLRRCWRGWEWGFHSDASWRSPLRTCDLDSGDRRPGMVTFWRRRRLSFRVRAVLRQVDGGLVPRQGDGGQVLSGHNCPYAPRAPHHHVVRTRFLNWDRLLGIGFLGQVFLCGFLEAGSLAVRFFGGWVLWISFFGGWILWGRLLGGWMLCARVFGGWIIFSRLERLDTRYA